MTDIQQDRQTRCVEVLYQRDPAEYDPSDTPKGWNGGWTRSLESYQKAARMEYHLLMAGHRRARHEIGINFLKRFTISEIKDKFKLIREYLVEYEITAFSIVEISRDGYGNPVNRVHYHFLIDSDLSKRQLRETFKSACRHAGLHPNKSEPDRTCRVLYRPIPDPKRDVDKQGNPLSPEEAFDKRVRYILKYNTLKKPILFRRRRDREKRINKIASINQWFINSDDSPMHKKKKWQEIIEGWYPKPAAKKLLQEIIRHPVEMKTSYYGLLQIGGQSYRWEATR